jgi:hypothetical protein
MGEQWIIDGHYRDVRHLIWERADLVVWLNYPLRTVALRLMERFRRKRSERASTAGQPGEVPLADRLHANGSASWRRRLGRVVRTLHERRLYGQHLRSPHYPNVRTVELRSIEATRQWLREL